MIFAFYYTFELVKFQKKGISFSQHKNSLSKSKSKTREIRIQKAQKALFHCMVYIEVK